MNKTEAGAIDFAEAAAKLTLNSVYRSQVESDPGILLQDFPGLKVAELGLLMSVWQAAKGLTGVATQAEPGSEGTYCCCCCCPKTDF